MKKDIKGSQLKEVRPIRGLAPPSKMPGTGGRQLKTIPAGVSAGAEIRDCGRNLLSGARWL